MEGITQRLRSYAASRKGELADLINEAADALEARDTDCISRLDTIDAVNMRIRQIGCENNPYVLSIVQSIREVPSVQPERKKGRWLVEYEDERKQIMWWECSECEQPMSWRPNFCPNCGVRMEEPEDIPMEYFESGGR